MRRVDLDARDLLAQAREPAQGAALVDVAVEQLAQGLALRGIREQREERARQPVVEADELAPGVEAGAQAALVALEGGGRDVAGSKRGAAVAGAAGAAAAGVRGGEVYDDASSESKQEYRQNQAQGAAAAGAVVGASKQRQDRREARADTKQQEAQIQNQAAAYQQSYQGCLTGRGYTVAP